MREPTLRWSSSGQQRAIAFAPHPDDEAIGCAGTLIRHRQRGDSVQSVIVTDGSRSVALGLDSRAMRACREKEARQAAARMGVDCRWLGLEEGGWSDEDGRRAIRRTLAEADPTIVYAPSRIDYHIEHRRVAGVLATALGELRSQAEVRIYSVQVPLTPLLANLVHDVSDLDAQIRSVVACYASQRESVMVAARLRRYAVRLYRVANSVEAFFSLPARDYVSLHTRPEARFRPLMMRAWTDPLAVLVGLPERIVWRRWGKGEARSELR
jgi:LmbE family N-acetylglucosaminyl deacetylase